MDYINGRDTPTPHEDQDKHEDKNLYRRFKELFFFFNSRRFKELGPMDFERTTDPIEAKSG